MVVSLCGRTFSTVTCTTDCKEKRRKSILKVQSNDEYALSPLPSLIHRPLLQYIEFLLRLNSSGRGQLKRDGTCAETRFRLSAKRTSPFKSAEASVQSTTGSRGVRISGSNAGYTMFRGSVKGTGYTLHSPVSPSLPLPCVTVCHHISNGICL